MDTLNTPFKAKDILITMEENIFIPIKEITKESLKLEIKSIAYNSKLVKKNYIFVAIKGLKDDGHKYIESAVKNKASIIMHLLIRCLSMSVSS